MYVGIIISMLVWNYNASYGNPVEVCFPHSMNTFLMYYIPFEVYFSLRGMWYNRWIRLKSRYLDISKVKIEIEPAKYKPSPKDVVHLYQQFNPIPTRVASKLTPPEFISFLTDDSKPVHAPKVFLTELKLGRLSKDSYAPLHDLPYPNPDHLRECLDRLTASKERLTKTVIRQFKGELSYRLVKDGFFLGARDSYIFYPFPDTHDLENKYYYWWRSALVQCF